MSSKLPAPIYIFLNYCDSSPLEKKILDCGAGGPNPPLSLFHESGYQTYGIEISEDQIYQSSLFCKEHNVHLNIIQGDMKDIPFQDVSFSFLFSYNTSVHIKKSDFSIAISEFFRVLQPGGLCYVNFLTHECSTYGAGTEINEGEFIQVDNDEDVLYCHYEERESDALLHSFEKIYKEKRTIKRVIDGKLCTSSYLDYIVKKPAS